MVEAPIRKPRIELDISRVDPIIANSTLFWDVELEIVNRSQVDDLLRWDNVQAYVGTKWYSTNVVPRPIHENDGRSTNISLYYQDKAGDLGSLDVGDVFLLSHLTRAFQGHPISFSLLSYPVLITLLELPPYWNETYTVSLGDVKVTLPGNGSSLGSIEVSILGHDPAWERVAWDDIDVALEKGGVLEDPYEKLRESLPNIWSIGISTMSREDLQVISNASYVSSHDVLRIKRLDQIAGNPRNLSGYDLILVTGEVLVGYITLPDDLPDTVR